MKVCEKVEQKGKTTYNEVADELVAEFAVDTSEGASALDQQYDEKNIRRRVYDALNVLMAMDIITKEKKNIMWRGLPTNTEQEGARLKVRAPAAAAGVAALAAAAGVAVAVAAVAAAVVAVAAAGAAAAARSSTQQPGPHRARPRPHARARPPA